MDPLAFIKDYPVVVTIPGMPLVQSKCTVRRTA